MSTEETSKNLMVSAISRYATAMKRLTSFVPDFQDNLGFEDVGNLSPQELETLILHDIEAHFLSFMSDQDYNTDNFLEVARLIRQGFGRGHMSDEDILSDFDRTITLCEADMDRDAESLPRLAKLAIDLGAGSEEIRQKASEPLQAALRQMVHSFVVISKSYTKESIFPSGEDIHTERATFRHLETMEYLHDTDLLHITEDQCMTEAMAFEMGLETPFSAPQKTLAAPMTTSQNLPVPVQNTSHANENTPEGSTSKLDTLLLELESLTGLEEVKEQVYQLIDMVEINQLNQQYNDKIKPMSLHMALSGSPGTGKTTIARLLGNIFKEMGLLSKGQLVEVVRSDLTDDKIGGSERKTKAKIDEAKGGILFIDEIQSMIPRYKNDFTKEANTELVAAMENRRDDFIVIIAGYPDKVKEYIACDDGFNDRFAIQVKFPDYTSDELADIMKSEFASQGLSVKMDNQFRAGLSEMIDWEKQRTGKKFGNARFVRNIIEGCIRASNSRIANGRKDISKRSGKELNSVTYSDLRHACHALYIQRREESLEEQQNKKSNFIGFIDTNTPKTSLGDMPSFLKNIRKRPSKRRDQIRGMMPN